MLSFGDHSLFGRVLTVTAAVDGVLTSLEFVCPFGDTGDDDASIPYAFQSHHLLLELIDINSLINNSLRHCRHINRLKF